MDLFKSTNSYMAEKVPDIMLTPEFEQYFTLFTFSLTADTHQSSEYLPICSSGIFVTFNWQMTTMDQCIYQATQNLDSPELSGYSCFRVA